MIKRSAMDLAAVILGPVNFAQLLIPDFSLIVCGYLVCRYTALNRGVWQQVESLVYFLLFPVLLFHSIVRSPLDLGAASNFIGAGLALGAAAIAMAYSLPRWPWVGRHIDAADHAAAAQVGFRFNSFIGLALVERLAGAQGQLLMAVAIGLCLPLFNVAAVLPMARRGERGIARELLRNPLIIATVSGLAFNLAGLRIPFWLEPSTARIGAASLAMGLMATGAGIQVGHLANAKLLCASLLGLKHLVLPLLAFGLAQLFSLNLTQSTVLLMFSALPAPPSAFVLASRMGFNGAYVAGLVALSTLLTMASLPLALGVLLPLLKLG